jgi:hypothetical protein
MHDPGTSITSNYTDQPQLTIITTDFTTLVGCILISSRQYNLLKVL